MQPEASIALALSQQLHQVLKGVLNLYQPLGFTSYQPDGNRDSRDVRMQMHWEEVLRAYRCIQQGAALNAVYCHDQSKMPLNLAIEIYLVTGDDTLFKAMAQRLGNQRLGNLETLKSNYNFRNAFVNAVQENIFQLKHLDGLLTLLEAQQGGRELLQACWPDIAHNLSLVDSENHELPLVLKLFLEHGYTMKGSVEDDALNSVIEALQEQQDGRQQNSSNKMAQALQPVLTELLAAYGADSQAGPASKVTGPVIVILRRQSCAPASYQPG